MDGAAGCGMERSPGPVELLREVLADVSGIAAAFVFGSIARGDAREESDVDVFIVDQGIDEDELSRRTLDAGVDLRREVNVIQFTPEEVVGKMRDELGFVSRVLAGPKCWIVGSEEDFQTAIAAVRG